VYVRRVQWHEPEAQAHEGDDGKQQATHVRSVATRTHGH
jgi:hypothetical protein